MRFIRNEWLGNREVITIMSEKRKPKYRFVILMNDYGEFEVNYEPVDNSDFQLERCDGLLHVVFAVPFNSERRACSAKSKIIRYCENDGRCVYNGLYSLPVSVIKDAIERYKNIFNYPQIDRLDLVEELYEH